MPAFAQIATRGAAWPLVRGNGGKQKKDANARPFFPAMFSSGR